MHQSDVIQDKENFNIVYQKITLNIIIMSFSLQK